MKAVLKELYEMQICRFLYINIYAFLLFVLGVFFTLLSMDIFLILFKYMVAALCAGSGISIFLQWKVKLRKIKVLVSRNKNELRYDTFRKLNETLCGQLMIRVALSDLRKTDNYRTLSKDEWVHCKNSLFPKKRKKNAKKADVLKQVFFGKEVSK
jgi:hypothetical protein